MRKVKGKMWFEGYRRSEKWKERVSVPLENDVVTEWSARRATLPKRRRWVLIQCLRVVETERDWFVCSEYCDVTHCACNEVCENSRVMMLWLVNGDCFCGTCWFHQTVEKWGLKYYRTVIIA